MSNTFIPKKETEDNISLALGKMNMSADTFIPEPEPVAPIEQHHQPAPTFSNVPSAEYLEAEKGIADLTNKVQGWRGTVQRVAEGPFGTVLRWTGKPLSYTTSFLKESIDFVSGGDASWSQMKEQAAQGYTFGRLLHDMDWLQGDDWASKWGARVLGFTGDVVFDPLTWVGLVGKGVAVGNHLLKGARSGGAQLAQASLRRHLADGIKGGLPALSARYSMKAFDDATMARLANTIGAAGKYDRNKTLGYLAKHQARQLKDGVWAVDLRTIGGDVGAQKVMMVGGKKQYALDVVEKNPALASLHDDIVLIPKELTKDIKELYKIQEVSGISALTDDQVQLASRHMFLNKMDKNGLTEFDLLADMKIRQAGEATRGAAHHGVRENWKGALFNSMEDAMGTKMAFGAKIPLAGPIGRALKIPWAAGKGYPASLKIARVPFSTPVLGPALQSVPQAFRRLAFGKDFAGTGRGIVGWMRTGGRYQAMRKLARSESANPVLRHQARQVLSAAGRGQWKGRIVQNQMIRHADQYVSKINGMTVDTPDGVLKGDDLKREIYHALGGDEDAIQRIQGHTLRNEDGSIMMEGILKEGQDLFETLRNIANKEAGTETEWVAKAPYYVPRILNEEAREYISRRSGTFGLQKGRITTTDATTRHELGRKLISDSQFDQLVAEKVAKGKTKPTAIWELGNEGYTRGFMGYKLYDVGEVLEPDHAWVQSNRVVSGKAPSIEQQIAYIMEDLNIGYSLFDDNIATALVAYVGGLSTRTGDVFVEEVLKKKGVFVDRIVSQTSFPTAQMDAVTQELHTVSRRISELSQEMGDLEGRFGRGDSAENITIQQYEAKRKELQVQIDYFEAQETKIHRLVDERLQLEKEVGEVEAQINAHKLQSADTQKELASISAADLPRLVQLQEKAFRIEQLLLEAISDKGRLKLAAQDLTTGTRQLMKNKQVLSSIYGSQANWEAMTVVFKDYDPSIHNNIDQYMNDILKDSVDEQGIGQAFDGLITSSGFVGQVDQMDAPNGLQWSFNPPEGASLNQVDFETNMMKLVYHMDEMDETAFGAWIAVEVQINATADNLVVNPVRQMENAIAQVEKKTNAAQAKIEEIETIIGREGIEEEILGLLPTVENVEAAQLTIMKHLDRSTADATGIADLGKNPKGMKESEELRSAINTFYGVFGNDFSAQPVTSGAEINNGLEQVANDLYNQVAAYQMALSGPEGALPDYIVRIKTPQGEVTQRFTLRDYVARRDIREVWRGHMGDMDTDNFISIDQLLNTGVVVQASSAAQANGINPSAKVGGKIQRVQGGTNIGFHIRANVGGDDVDFYVKMYEPNMQQGPEAAVFDEFGHSLEDVARNRVQAEVLSDALYRELRILTSKGKATRAAPDSWHSYSTDASQTFLTQADNAGPIPVGDMLKNGHWKMARFSEGLAFPQGSPPISEVSVIQFKDGSFNLASNASELAMYQAQDNVQSISRMSDRIQEQMLMDILISNSDVVGFDSDNIGIDILTGEIIRIDNGAAFHYRAQGLSKAKTQGFDWRVVDELESPDGGMGTFFSSEFENQPSRWQTMFRNEMEKGSDFWLRMGDQFASLVEMRSHHGGWEPFVRKTLGTDATELDVRMFTEWLEVRTQGIHDILNRNLDGQAPELLQGEDLLKAKVAKTSFGNEGAQSMDEMYGPTQMTSKAEGLPAWISNDGETQAIQAVPLNEAAKKIKDGADPSLAVGATERDLEVIKMVQELRDNNDPLWDVAMANESKYAVDPTDTFYENALFEEDAIVPTNQTTADDIMREERFGAGYEEDLNFQDDGYLDDENFEILMKEHGGFDTYRTDELARGELPDTGDLTIEQYDALLKWSNYSKFDLDDLFEQWDLDILPDSTKEKILGIIKDADDAVALTKTAGKLSVLKTRWRGSAADDTITHNGREIQVRYGVVVLDDSGNIVLRMPTDDPATGQPFGGVKWTFAKGGKDKGETVMQAAQREAHEELNVMVDIYGALPETTPTGNSVTRYFVARPKRGQPPIGKVTTSADDIARKTRLLVNNALPIANPASGGMKANLDQVPPYDMLNVQSVIDGDNWVDSNWINTTQQGTWYSAYNPNTTSSPVSGAQLTIQTPKGSDSIRILGLPDGETVGKAQESLFYAPSDSANVLGKDNFDKMQLLNTELDELQNAQLLNIDPAASRAGKYLRGTTTANTGHAFRDHEIMVLEYTYKNDKETYEALIDFMEQGHTKIPEVENFPLTKEQERFTEWFNARETAEYNDSRLKLGAATLRTMKALDGRDIQAWDQLSFKQKLSFLGYLEMQGGVLAPWEQVYLGRARGAQLNDEEIAFLMAVAPMGTAHKDLAQTLGGDAHAGFLTAGLWDNSLSGKTNSGFINEFSGDMIENLAPIRFKGDRRTVQQFQNTLEGHLALLGTEGDMTMLDGGAIANNAIVEHASDFYIENQEFIDRWIKRIADIRYGSAKPLNGMEIRELREWTVKNVMDKMRHQEKGLIRLQTASERSIQEDINFFLALNDKNTGMGWVNQEVTMNSPLVRNLVGTRFGGGHDGHLGSAGGAMYTGGTVLDVSPTKLKGINPQKLQKDFVAAVNKIDPKTDIGKQQINALLMDMGIDPKRFINKHTKGSKGYDKAKAHINEQVKRILHWDGESATGAATKRFTPLTFGREAVQSSRIGSYIWGQGHGKGAFGIHLQDNSILGHIAAIRQGTASQNFTAGYAGGKRAPRPMFDPVTGRRVSAAQADPTFEWLRKAGEKTEAQLSEYATGRASLSGSTNASWHATMDMFLDQVPSLQKATLVPEAFLYQRMLDASQVGLAADGYGAIAFIHREGLEMLPEVGGAWRDGRYWGNVLLANPVSVLNTSEQLARTVDGVTYSFDDPFKRPVIGGQKFIDDYEDWANTVLDNGYANSQKRTSFSQDDWAAAEIARPDNPLSWLQEKNRTKLLEHRKEMQVELKELSDSIEAGKLELDTLKQNISDKRKRDLDPIESDYWEIQDRVLEAEEAAEYLLERWDERLVRAATPHTFSTGETTGGFFTSPSGRIEGSWNAEEMANQLTEALTLLDSETASIATELSEQLTLYASISNNAEKFIKNLTKKQRAYMDDGWLRLNKMSDDEVNRFVNTWESTWQSGFKAYGVGSQGPEEIVASMGDVIKWQAEGGMRKFLRTYDAVHNLVKGYLIGKSGFHSRNFFSGVFMNSLAGVGNPKTYRAFQRAYWKSQYEWARQEGLDRYANSLRSSMRKRGIWDSISAVSPEDVKIIDQMRDGGVLGGSAGMTATEFSGGKPLSAKLGTVEGARRAFSKINPFNSRNAFLQLNRDVGVGTETYLRGVLAFDTIKKGGSIDDAFENVIKYHFDYEDLSMFERAVVKRVFPFYVWTKRAVPLMVEEIFKQPKKFARVEHFKKEFTGYGEEDNAPVPDYFTRQGGFQTPWSYKGEKMWILPDLPQKVLAETFDPFVTSQGTPLDKLVGGFSTFGSNLSPLLKAPLERMTSRNFWKGYNYDGRFVQVPAAFNIDGMTHALLTAGIYKRASNGTLMVRDYDMNFLMTSLPILGDVRRLLPDEQRYQDRVLSTYLSYFTGIGLRTNTKDEQERTLQSQGYAQQEIDDLLKWMERESVKEK